MSKMKLASWVLLVIVFVGLLLFSAAILCGCEENDDSVTAPIITPQGVKDFSGLDKLCWRFKLEKSGLPADWTVTCTFEKRIPHVSPNQTIVTSDSDLSKALSKALSEVRTQLGVDSVIVDGIE